MTAFVLNTALGLSRNPFPPTPDAGSYFFTPHLQEQFSELVHCIEARKGFLLLTGEVGLGKSTLVRRLLDSLNPERTRSALVFNTFLQGEALLAAILRDFGLPPPESLDEGLARFNEFLMQQHRLGVTCLLVIDDAQNLKPESLELVRLLCNLETAQEKLLQILLAGQPELESVLDTPGMRQLKSRLVKHTRLSGLQREELGRYFDFRLNAAGGAGRISLQPAAARLLHSATEGNLRRIHLVLDRCLYGLAALGRQSVDVDLMKAALRDVSLVPQAGAGGGRYRGALLGAGAALSLIALVWLAQELDWASPARAAVLAAWSGQPKSAAQAAPTGRADTPATATASAEPGGPSSSSVATTAPATAATSPATSPAPAATPAAALAPASAEAAPDPMPPTTTTTTTASASPAAAVAASGPASAGATSSAPAAAPPPVARPSAANPVAIPAPTSAPTPTPTPAPAATRAAASAALAEEDCERQLGRAPSGLQVQRQALPATLVERVRKLRGVCVFERAGAPWLLWHERPRPAQANPVTETPQARQLQDQLVRHGALAASAVDGLYGPRTATALARFQSAHGLEISAVPDPLTSLVLEKLEPSAAGTRHE